MIIKETLSHLGVDCKTFTLSEMAFDELSHSEPDILFVDYNMPDISGIDFVEELKFNNLARGSKLICITGDTTKSTRIKLDEHFDQVLYKPVRQKSLQELIDALKASLNTKRHLIELGKQRSNLDPITLCRFIYFQYRNQLSYSVCKGRYLNYQKICTLMPTSQ